MKQKTPFFYVIAGLLLYLLCSAFLPVRFGRVLATLICDAGLIVFCLIVLKKYSYQGQKMFSVHKYSTAQILLWFGLFLLMFYIGQIAGITIRDVFGDPSFDEYSTTLNESELWLSTAVILLAAPISEELIYRGLLYQSFRSLFESRTKNAALIALLLQAVLFAASHMTLTHLAPCFIMAVFNQLLLKRTKSFFYPILSHIGYNFFSMIGMPFPAWLASPWLIAVLYIALAGGLIYAFLQKADISTDGRSDIDRLQQ